MNLLLGKHTDERRRIYLIDRKFQWEFIFGFVFILILFTAIVYIFSGVYYYLKYQVGGAIFNDYLLIIRKGETLKVTNVFKIMIPILSWTCGLFIVFICVYGLFFTHKISGPIYRVKKALELIGKGKLDFQMNLRKKDKFQELTNYVNNLINSLGSSLYGLKKNNDSLIKELKELSTNLSKASIDKRKTKDIIKNIEKTASQIQKGFNTIKVRQPEQK